MRTIKIGFNPEHLDVESEAWPAFAAGGMTLTIWALWKSKFITSQHFRPALVNVSEYFEKAFDPEDESEVPYTNIDEFAEMLGKCGFNSISVIGFGQLREWIVSNWDHFNLNIQRAITLEYEVIEPVTKKLIVGALTGKEK